MFSDGAAHLLALTAHRNASGTCILILYVDGGTVTTQTTTCAGATSIVASTNAGLGGRISYQAGIQPFFGQMAGVAIFTTALTAAQIAGLANEQTGPPPASNSGYDASVLSLGPYAYYRLNERSGITAFDASGNNRNGTYEGSSGTDYLLGQPSILPGDTQGVSVETFATNPGAPKVSIPSVSLESNGSTWLSDFSVSAWATAATSVSQEAQIVELNDYYFGRGVTGNTPGAAFTPMMGDFDFYNWASSTPTFADGKAHLSVMTVHQNSAGTCDLNLYIDGSVVSSEPGTQCVGANVLWNTNAGIAGRVSGNAQDPVGDFPWAGEVAGVAIFSCALTPSQIGNLYNYTGQPALGPSPYNAAVLSLSPYAYYPLNERSGTTAYDASGNGRNGTYEGVSGTDYILGKPSILPNDNCDASATVEATNPGAPKVALPNVNLGWNGKTWVSDFSISAWAEANTALAQEAQIMEINDYYFGQGVSGLIPSSSFTPMMGAFGANNWAGSTPTFSDGKPHLLVMTIHQNSSGTCDLYLYVDGSEAISALGTPCQGSNYLYSTNSGIGGRVSGNANDPVGDFPWAGQIGGVAIYPTALTPAQAASLY